jgi:hypothetical protein
MLKIKFVLSYYLNGNISKKLILFRRGNTYNNMKIDETLYIISITKQIFHCGIFSFGLCMIKSETDAPNGVWHISHIHGVVIQYVWGGFGERCEPRGLPCGSGQITYTFACAGPASG